MIYIGNNMTFKANQETWKKIYASSSFDISYPSEILVRYISHLFKKGNGLKLLDFGFGAGSNLKFLIDFGFDAYGAETVEAAKKIALRKLNPDFDALKLKLADEDKPIPFSSNFFDVIVAWGVLYYNNEENFIKALFELKRTLRAGGKFIATLCRPNDVTAVNSERISVCERRINKPISGQQDAIIIVLEDEQQIKSRFNLFHDLRIGYSESRLPDDAVSSHWIICGEK